VSITQRKRKRMHPLLASARAYFRLAGKAWRAGNSGEAIAYTEQARRIQDRYYREMEAKARREEGEKKYRKELAAKVAARKAAAGG